MLEITFLYSTVQLSWPDVFVLDKRELRYYIQIAKTTNVCRIYGSGVFELSFAFTEGSMQGEEGNDFVCEPIHFHLKHNWEFLSKTQLTRHISSHVYFLKNFKQFLCGKDYTNKSSSPRRRTEKADSTKSWSRDTPDVCRLKNVMLKASNTFLLRKNVLSFRVLCTIGENKWPSFWWRLSLRNLMIKILKSTCLLPTKTLIFWW